jgi:hypothetical protein
MSRADWRVRWMFFVPAAALGLAACAESSSNNADAAMRDAGSGDAGRDTSNLPYARDVISFEPGDNAGFGQDELPGVVIGPPNYVESGGSLKVLSLGVGGEIVLGFGDRDIVDGEGADFIVFENAFWAGGDPTKVFAEPGEVAVSEDGKAWHAFDCDSAGDGDGHYAGCAGWTPTLEFDPFEMLELDPELTGGDAFDLADVKLDRARFVRIRDLAAMGEGKTAGFDLDAVGVVHGEER